MPIEGNCTNEEMLPLSIAFTTLGGRPAEVQGDPTVTLVSGDPTASVRPGPDAFHPFLASGDLPGDLVFLVSGDADLGEGVVLVQDTVTIHVAGAQAGAVGLSLGAAVPKV